jgi:hypothetical protein
VLHGVISPESDRSFLPSDLTSGSLFPMLESNEEEEEEEELLCLEKQQQ